MFRLLLKPSWSIPIAAVFCLLQTTPVQGKTSSGAMPLASGADTRPAASSPQTGADATVSRAVGFMARTVTALPVATAPIYANTASALFSYNPASGQPAWIGDFSLNGNAVTDVSDIAIDATGHLFAVSTTELYAVNPQTAALTPLLQHGIAGANGLTCLSSGAMVIAGNGVAAIDPATMAVQTLVAAGQYQSSGDIIALPNNMLYWTVDNGSGSDLLVRIDPRTGATTVLGNTGVQSIFGLGYAAGELYGFTSQGAIVTIDVDSARVSGELPLSQPQAWHGATTNPAAWLDVSVRSFASAGRARPAPAGR